MITIQFLKEDSERLILGYKGKFPIVACWRLNPAQVGFYCPYCKKIHKHGFADGNPSGHRTAHCINPESPFKKTGYILSYQETKRSRCDKCGKETENISDYFDLICNDCKNKYYTPETKLKQTIK